MSEHHDAAKAHEPAPSTRTAPSRAPAIPKRSTPKCRPTLPTGRKSSASPAMPSAPTGAADEEREFSRSGLIIDKQEALQGSMGRWYPRFVADKDRTKMEWDGILTTKTA